MKLEKYIKKMPIWQIVIAIGVILIGVFVYPTFLTETPAHKYTTGDIVIHHGDMIEITGEPFYNEYGIYVYPLEYLNPLGWTPTQLDVIGIDNEATLYVE